MPLYEYRCNPCGEFEAWRSMSEYNAPINCPQCQQAATKLNQTKPKIKNGSDLIYHSP